MWSALWFFGLALIFPLFTGPVAGYIYLRLLAARPRRGLPLFWPTLLLLNGFGFLFLLRIPGDDLLDPAFFSCLVTPIVAVLTALQIRIGGRRLETAVGAARRLLLIGLLLIPALQLTTMALFVLLAPYLCQIGWRSCWPG